jgi:hypothetical protein
VPGLGGRGTANGVDTELLSKLPPELSVVHRGVT